MSKSIKNILSQLLTISRRLAESAANGTWDQVAELENEQRELLAYFFARKGDQPMTAETMSGLAQVRLYTDMVLVLAKEKRTELVHASDKMQATKKAINAYAECV